MKLMNEIEVRPCTSLNILFMFIFICRSYLLHELFVMCRLYSSFEGLLLERLILLPDDESICLLVSCHILKMFSCAGNEAKSVVKNFVVKYWGRQI